MTAVLGRTRLVPPGPGTAVGPEAAPAASTEPPPVAIPPRRALPPAPAAEEPASPGRLRRMWILPAAVVVAGALALVPVVRDDAPGPSEAEVRVNGTATVTRAGGGTEVIADASVRIGAGDVIEITGGTARFARPDDVTFEGRAGAAVAGRAGTTVKMGTVPELLAGPLLVVAPTPAELRAAGAGVTVRPAGGEPGAARLDRRLGLGVGTYTGAADIDSAGRRARVDALHRLEVAAPGAFGRRDLPLAYTAADPWDRRFLADALLVDRQLGPLLVAFDASTGTGGATVADLRRAVPSRPAADLGDVVAGAPTGSAALVTALLADLGRGGTFPSRAMAVQRFRAAGARWGLVTLDRGVAPDALLTAVRAALDRLGPDVGASSTDVTAEPSTPPPPTAGPPGTDPGAGPGAAGAVPPEAGPDEGSTTPPPPGGTSLPPPPPPGLIPPAVPPVPDPGSGGGTVGGVVDGVGGTVGGVVEGAGEAVGDIVEGAGSTLGGVVDGLLGTVDTLLSGGTTPPPDGALGLGIAGL